MASSRNPVTRPEQILRRSREPCFWLNAELKLIWVNRAWEELTGHSAASVAGLVCQPHGPTYPGDPRGLGGSFYPPAETIAGQPASARTLILHPSGERFWRRVEYLPFHNEKEELAAILGLVRNPEDDSRSPLGPNSEAHRVRSELLEVRDQLLKRHGVDDLIGRGPAHRRLMDQVTAASATSIPVLIVGEPGTGKRLVARTIHLQSSRRDAPFFRLDCSALSPEVLEREIFGSSPNLREGGEVRETIFPEGSTLLLESVGDLPRDLQGRLALTSGDRVRLLACMTTEPETALASEQFRPDFYYAFTTLIIRLTPLRERLEELPVIAQHLLERTNLPGGRQRRGFSDDATRTLLLYDWPGNVRELARVIEVAHGQGESDLVESMDLPAEIRGHYSASYLSQASPGAESPDTLDQLLTQVECRLIESALKRCRQNRSRAAERLGISRPRLYRRIKELNLPDEEEPIA
ncbi:MAG: hypothetical protein NVSMB9_07270 [Isosphaeraceae bacterium]